MSAVSKEELASWLIRNGYAEPKRGYGHVSGDELAGELLAAFTVARPTPSQPKGPNDE